MRTANLWRGSHVLQQEVVDEGIDLVGDLERGQVRCTIDHDEAGAGDCLGHDAGLGDGERRVLRSGDDQHRRPDAAEQLALVGSLGNDAPHGPRR